jgi:hypothetical protein
MKFLVSHEIRYMKQNRQIGGGRKLGNWAIYVNEGLVTVHEYVFGQSEFFIDKNSDVGWTFR